MNPKKTNRTFNIIFACILYVFILGFLLHYGSLLSQYPKGEGLQIIMLAVDNLSKHPFSFGPINFMVIKTVGIGTFIYGITILALIVEAERNARSMPGKEKGSAQWNTDYNKYNKKFTEPFKKTDNNGQNNMILSQNVFLSMNGRKTLRNNNVLIIGGSGTGKSRFIAKPNILQGNASFVVTDPAGELLESTGKYLEKEGYKIKIFNLVQMAKSSRYNPFEYIRDDLGVQMLVNCLIKNTTPEGAGKGDPFWEKSETALLQALILYLVHYADKSEQNFSSVMKLLRAAEVNENDPNAKSPLDRVFEEVEKKNPGDLALKQYKTFKMGAGKTLKSILISCAVRLTAFNMQEIERLTSADDLELQKIGDEKTALFVIIPAADDTFNFLVSMMYSQLFETLYYHAETECPGKRLPFQVQCLLDEFANIGTIPDFEKKLATMRKYGIGCTIFLQGLSQLKSMYEKDYAAMVGNCDTKVFLGGDDDETLKYITEHLGKATIVVRNNSRSRGSKGSSSLSYNRDGRALMEKDELGLMDNKECIVLIRGIRPFRDFKFPYEKHKNYKYTADAKASNIYQVPNRRDAEEDPNQFLMEREEAKAMRYAKARSSASPKDKLVGRPMKQENFMKGLKINNMKEVDQRIVLETPEVAKTVPDEVSKKAQADFEQKKQEQKKKKEQAIQNEEWDFTAF